MSSDTDPHCPEHDSNAPWCMVCRELLIQPVSDARLRALAEICTTYAPEFHSIARELRIFRRVRDLEEQMRNVKRLAEFNIREAFQDKWGHFFRCSGCLARVYAAEWPQEGNLSRCCKAPIREHRYSYSCAEPM